MSILGVIPIISQLCCHVRRQVALRTNFNAATRQKSIHGLGYGSDGPPTTATAHGPAAAFLETDFTLQKKCRKLGVYCPLFATAGTTVSV